MPPPSGLICGDCATEMAKLPEDSVDLVVTSPPYAQQRKDLYGGGAPAGKYVEWFMPVANEIRRVLKPSGSFVLNIKEHVVDGERSTYVMELVMAMRAAGWRWVDDYIWHKPNPFPGHWPNRLKDGWEHLHHFTTCKKIKMNPSSVMKELSDYTAWDIKHHPRYKRKDSMSNTIYGYTIKHGRLAGMTAARPSNVLVTPLSAQKKTGHPATYPRLIPDFFIRLFTDPGDLVLDPFVGSGTTALAAAQLGRRWIGIDISPEYIAGAEKRLAPLIGQARLAST